MKIAELFVRLTADTRGFKGNMSDAERAMNSFGKTSVATERQTGRATQGVARLGGQFGTLLGQMTGVNPTLIRIGSTLSTFAYNAGPVAVAIVGLTALAAVWQRITRDSRAAGKEMGDALERLKAIQTREAQGVFGQTGADVTSGMTLAGKLSRDIRREKGLLGREGATFMETELRKRNIARLTQQYNEAVAAVKAGERSVWKAVEDARPPDPKIATTRIGAALRADLIGVNLSADQLDRAVANERSGRDLAGAGIAASAEAELAAGNRPGALISTLQAQVRAQTGFVEQTRTLGDKLREGLEVLKTGLLQGLVGVAQAMLPGGGGTGSRIGSALGSAVLGTIGIGGGPIGAAVGGVVGALAGSLFGGLFDKKKKVANGLDLMADGLARVNEQLRNAPSGYMVRRQQLRATGGPPNPFGPTDPTPGGGRGPQPVAVYNISELKVLANDTASLTREIGRAARQEASRGGVTQFQLAAAT